MTRTTTQTPRRVFRDRREAGRVLARLLHAYRGKPDVVVLGLPRGDIPVAWEVAAALGAPLDAFVVRKLGAPGREEFAVGAMALGGRVAEEVVFNEITTGAQDDIKRATRLARAMVCELGMSQRLGPIAYGENEESVFLGREMTSRREDYSEETAREIDEEVRQIVDSQHTYHAV